MTKEKIILTDDKLYGYAFTDSIAGLNNKNYITEILPMVVASRAAQKYSVIVLGMDNFEYINDTCGYEALVRWTDKEYGYIPPSEFIPLAEETEIIIQLGRYVIKKVCQQIKNWGSFRFKDISVAINLSARQFRDKSLPSYILELLEQYELSPDIFEFEVTETILIKDIEDSAKMLSYFQQKGIKIAIDDFWTGFSSYKYLSKMNFNTIKIDKAFIDIINIDMKKSLIVKNIIDLAHIIGSEIVAEGVENEEQLTVLKKYDCDIIQGFYYSKPMPTEELERYIKSKSF